MFVLIDYDSKYYVSKLTVLFLMSLLEESTITITNRYILPYYWNIFRRSSLPLQDSLSPATSLSPEHDLQFDVVLS